MASMPYSVTPENIILEEWDIVHKNTFRKVESLDDTDPIDFGSVRQAIADAIKLYDDVVTVPLTGIDTGPGGYSNNGEIRFGFFYIEPPSSLGAASGIGNFPGDGLEGQVPGISGDVFLNLHPTGLNALSDVSLGSRGGLIVRQL